MVEVTYREAIRRGLSRLLDTDARVFIMGEDVGAYGGSYAVTKGFLEKYGPERIRDTPLSESGFVGAGIGAAIAGMRPIVEVMTVNFSLLALDQIINNAATLCHMSGGQFHVPLVIRMSTGAGNQLAAQHSHSWEGWYAHIPGLKILTPATIQDAYTMVQVAMEDPNPVIIFEHAMLYNTKGELNEGTIDRDIYRAICRRKGTDVTLITFGGCLARVLAAAENLAEQGIRAEVLDLRSLRPLDDETIFASIRRTNRAVIVDDGWQTGAMAAEIMARLGESCFYELDAPLARVCGVEVPIPYAKHLETAALPQVGKIVAKVREVMAHND